MKKLLYITAFMISITGCSQNNKTEATERNENKKNMNIDQYIPEESKNITANNYAEKVFESIKRYKEEPIYYFRVNKQNCVIEVEVNDIYSFNDYELSNYITPIEIGNILKSGPQKVTVKMYPVGNLNNESWGKTNAKPMTRLVENSQVSISVIEMDEKGSKGLDDEKLITTQISPKEAAGKEYYEFSFTFDAQVPYEFEGWTKGQDLRKLDQDLVRQKAVEFYRMVGDLYMNKDLESGLKLEFPVDKRIMGASYVDKKYLEELLEEYRSDFSRDYSIEIPHHIYVDYMGEGKLVMLKNKLLDSPYRGGGALILKYGKKGIYLPGIIVYLPEGRDLATQGFMMWK